MIRKLRVSLELLCRYVNEGGLACRQGGPQVAKYAQSASGGTATTFRRRTMRRKFEMRPQKNPED
jgi:hypothetical protein